MSADIMRATLADEVRDALMLHHIGSSGQNLIDTLPLSA